MADVLVIDDDIHMCRFLSAKLKRLGHQTAYVQTLSNGLEEVDKHSFDIVFLDVNLPDGNGLEILPKLRQASSQPEVIIITGKGEPDGAELAIRSNAWDYIQKDSSFTSIQLSLKRAVQFREEKLSRRKEQALDRSTIVGTSNAIEDCIEKLSKAVTTSNPVLITGETGTGKELFAKSIHANSDRKKNSFVVIDCAALPESLVESTIFGHKKGAFTSADTSQAGLVTQADKGTLFLDEIGELPMAIQKKFLRVLQERRYRPVGEKKELTSDFRLICATNRDLSEMVSEGTFREDLYYRIVAFTITIPPLRERKEDIPLLINHYFRHHGSRAPDKKPHTVSGDFFDALQAYDWPGNVRQLFHAMSYAHTEAMDGTSLLPRHLPLPIRTEALKKKFQVNIPAGPQNPVKGCQPEAGVLMNMKDYMERSREQYIIDLMEITGGSVQEACSISGLSRGHLYQLINKYNVR